jgi:hypothetical protein
LFDILKAQIKPSQRRKEKMKESNNELKAEIASYVEGLPLSLKKFDTAMKYLEILGLGVIAFAFLVALYFSITWKSVNPMTIPLAWFAFAVTGSLIMLLSGTHSAILHAFPAGILPSNAKKLITGSKAMWIGVVMVIGGLAYAAFWLMMAYGTVTANFEILRPLISFLGIILGFGIAISIIVKIASTSFKKLS